MTARLTPWICAVVVGMLGLLPGSAAAAPGDVDFSFGGGTGKAVVDLGGDDSGNDVVLQPDGRILVGGTDDNVGFVAARFTNPAAQLDPTFGGGTGHTTSNFPDGANAIALQSDGKIVLAGNTGPNMGAARYLNPQGVLDTSYGLGTGGSVMDFSGFDRGNDLALQSDGKILVAGTANATVANSDFAVARLLNPQGTFDTSYGGGTGKSQVDLVSSDTDVARAMALQTDGKILVAGYTNGFGGNDFALLRLTNPGGVPDPGFRLGTGKAISDLGGTDDEAQAVLQQPDGKILLAGFTNAGGTRDFVVIRLANPQGNLDPTFGNSSGNRAIANFGGSDTGLDMALQPDGKIVVAGYTDVGGDTDFAVARFMPNGALDTSFGSGGKSIFDLGGNDFGAALALQPDGKSVVAGSTDAGSGVLTNVALARFVGGEPTGYIRPKSATEIRIPLVPAFRQCTSANRTHGPPLVNPSCNPPVQQSDNLTVGTPDANSAAANSEGSVRLEVLAGTPGPPDDSDVAMALHMTDVRCRAGVATCGSANSAGGADYTGELYLFYGATGRLTDKYNDATGSAGATEMGTVQDFTFNGATATCSSTPSTAIGATCSFSTTANAVLPGTVKDGKRAIWQPNSSIFVSDGGTDGDAQSPPNQTFATQGIFVP